MGGGLSQPIVEVVGERATHLIGLRDQTEICYWDVTLCILSV
jgi:hypothetical protein